MVVVAQRQAAMIRSGHDASFLVRTILSRTPECHLRGSGPGHDRKPLGYAESLKRLNALPIPGWANL